MAAPHGRILVLGATGRQGGATARQLLARGWRVSALVRDPNKPAAQALQRAGADVIRGDYADRASLNAARQGAYGVFSVQPFSDDQARQGKAIAGAARAAGIEHFIYTSVQSAERLAPTGSNADAKWEIEQHIRSLGLPATILRPPLFMEFAIGPSFGVPQGTLTTAWRPDVPLLLIAVNDIGAFAALAFEHPDTYLGKTLEIAGDALTPPQIAAISRAAGQPVPYVQIPIETLRRQNEEAANAFRVLGEPGHAVDLPTLRTLHPGLMDFETWLQKEGKAQLAIAP